MAVNNLDAFKENQEKEVIDTNRKLRVGIVGTGGIARAHMRSEEHTSELQSHC